MPQKNVLFFAKLKFQPFLSLHYPYAWDMGQYSTDFMNMHALGRAVEKRKTVINLECRGPRQRPADGPFPPVSAIDFGSTSVQATAMAEMPAPIRSLVSSVQLPGLLWNPYVNFLWRKLTVSVLRLTVPVLWACPGSLPTSAWALGSLGKQKQTLRANMKRLLWAAASMTFSLFSKLSS